MLRTPTPIAHIMPNINSFFVIRLDDRFYLQLDDIFSEYVILYKCPKSKLVTELH